MNFKKLLIPFAAMSMVLGGCSWVGPDYDDWSQDIKTFMIQKFDYVAPYPDNLTAEGFAIIDGSNKVTVHDYFDEEEDAKQFLINYHFKLQDDGFDGDWWEEDFDEETKNYYGSWTRDTGISKTIFDEEWELPLDIEISLLDNDYFYYLVIEYFLGSEYHTTAGPVNSLIENVLGSAEFDTIGGESYEYRYIQLEAGYRFDLRVLDSDLNEEGVVNSFKNKFYNVEKGVSFSDYKYSCIPWKEECQVKLTRFVNSGTKTNIEMSYQLYSGTTVRDSFPASSLATFLGVEDSDIPTFSSAAGFGFKLYDKYGTAMMYVDAIDPQKDHPEYDPLTVSYAQTLTEAGFAGEGTGVYVKTFTALNKKMCVMFTEENKYFHCGFIMIDAE